MPFRAVLLVFLCLNCMSWLQAQVDTTMVLPTVKVDDVLIRMKDIGGSMISGKEIRRRGTFSHVAGELAFSNTGYVRSDGIGGVSTLSLRGSSSSQTSVNWNGLPIESPMLGVLDLALLPSSLIDNWELHKGGNSAKWGSGAIGGILLIESGLPEVDTSLLSLGMLIGSFGLYEGKVRVDQKKGRWASRTNLYHQYALNNFAYTAEGVEIGSQTNAEVQKSAILQSVGLSLDNGGVLMANVWWQSSDVEIPPTLRQVESEAFQLDQSIRSMMSYQQTFRKMVLSTKIGLFKEDQAYHDPVNQLAAQFNFNSWLFDVDLNGILTEKWRWHLATTYNHNVVDSDNFFAGITQNRIGITAGIIYESDMVGVQLGSRQEFVDGTAVPFVPSLGAAFQINPAWQLLMKIGRNYRFPTLNDRFWQPGGNPDLRAESGWSQEFGLKYQLIAGNIESEQKLILFNRRINDWIAWVPQTGSPIWAPMNISEVWSRGLELDGQVLLIHEKLNVIWPYNLQLVRSTHEVDLKSPSIEKGEQIFYVPELMASTGLHLSMDRLTIGYHHRWVGSVQGINREVDPFHVGDCHFSFRIVAHEAAWHLNVQLNNLWGADYQVIEDRPMPGRAFNFGLQLNLSK